MTLRLTEEETAALRARAQEEGCSMQDIARRAISEYVGGRSDRLAAAIAHVAEHDAELLDRLSR